MEVQRPLDLLNNSKGKRVMVALKSGIKFTGVLVAFDIHVNLVLRDTVMIKEDGTSVNLGYAFIRGDTVLFVSPSE